MPAHRSIPSHLHLTSTPLPAPDLSLAAHAHDLAELAAWLLASNNAPLLSVVLCAGERDPAMPVTLWNTDNRPDAALSTQIAMPDYRFGAVVRGIGKAADGLWEALRPRWPGSVPPRRLGIITDGSGLGFCPDDPCPLVPGWLPRQIRDRASLTCLLPFVPDGAWVRLTGPSA